MVWTCNGTISKDRRRYRRLVVFAFCGGGPASNWTVELDWFTPGGRRAYVCLPPGDVPDPHWTCIAAVEPATPEAAATFLKDFLGRDGAGYGLRDGFLRYFPSEVWYVHRKLISSHALRESLAAFLRGIGAKDDWRLGCLQASIRPAFDSFLLKGRRERDAPSLVGEYLQWNAGVQRRWPR